MTESMHEFVVRQLEGSKLPDWQRLEKACGVPARTIEKVARRVYKSHRMITIEPLAEHLGYFEQFQRRRRPS
jgi:hypothetical protein